ncbi:unnamed protein product [Caretta caretta]
MGKQKAPATSSLPGAPESQHISRSGQAIKSTIKCTRVSQILVSHKEYFKDTRERCLLLTMGGKRRQRRKDSDES